jgi:hypothetical protein
MAGMTIDAKDPKALIAVVKAMATTPTQQGTLAADLFAYSAAVAQGKSKDEAVRAVIDLRVERDRKTPGRSLWEPINAFEAYDVPFSKMAEGVAPAVSTLIGAAVGTAVQPGPGTVAAGVAGKEVGVVDAAAAAPCTGENRHTYSPETRNQAVARGDSTAGHLGVTCNFVTLATRWDPIFDSDIVKDAWDCHVVWHFWSSSTAGGLDGNDLVICSWYGGSGRRVPANAAGDSAAG